MPHPLPSPAPTATRISPEPSALPGLVVVGVAVAAAWLAARSFGALSPLTAAVALGAVAGNLGVLPSWTRPATRFAARTLLRAGIVLLGFRLAIGEVARLGGPTLLVVLAVVAVTFVGTQWMGRRLGVSPSLSLLVATGFSICGASAIAAMQSVAKGEEEEVGFSIALVTLCGSLAIVVLPLLQAPLGLGVEAFGRWAGASVHDVGQVVAAASVVGPRALEAAVVVKLTRVVLLGPLVLAVGLSRRRARLSDAAVAGSTTTPRLVPMFVVGFLVTAGIRSTGLLPSTMLDGLQTVESLVLTAALFGLGTDIRLQRLRALGGRPLVLGLLSWLLIAAASYVGIMLVSSPAP